MWCRCCTKFAAQLGKKFLSSFVKNCPDFHPPDRKRQTVNLHFHSKSHRACREKSHSEEKLVSTSELYKKISKICPEMENKLQKLFRIVFAMVKEDRAAIRFPFECQLQELNGVILGTKYKTKDSFKEFLSFIDKDLLIRVISEVNNANAISFITDGSTSKANIEYEAVFVRFISIDPNEGLGVINTRLVGLGSIEISANADGLLKSISDVLQLARVQNWSEKLICCTVDGASVNVGCKGGLVKKMGVPVSVHSYNHILDLSFKSTMKTTVAGKKILSLIRCVSNFYRTSPKLMRRLNELGTVIGVQILSFKPVCQTRWADSMQAAIKPLIQNYPALMNHLEQIASPHEATYKGDQKATAKGMLKELAIYSTVYLLHGIYDFVTCIAKASSQLEAKNLTIRDASIIIKSIISNLKEMENCKHEDVELFTMLKNFHSRCKFVSESQVWEFHGHKLSPATSSRRQQQEEDSCSQLLTALLKNSLKTVKERCLQDSPLLKVFDKMDGALMPCDDISSEYGNQEISNMCQLLNIDISSALEEWGELRGFIASHFKSGTNYLRLLYMLSTDSLKHLKIMRQLTEVLLCIPPSVADVEHVWSSMKNVLEDRKLSMKHEVLQARLRIKCNGGELETFDPTEAINLWWNSSISNDRIRRT